MARVRAAERDTSVSALVGEYLRSLAGSGTEFSALEARQREIRGRIRSFRAADRLDRDQVHERALH